MTGDLFDRLIGEARAPDRSVRPVLLPVFPIRLPEAHARSIAPLRTEIAPLRELISESVAPSIPPRAPDPVALPSTPAVVELTSLAPSPMPTPPAPRVVDPVVRVDQRAPEPTGIAPVAPVQPLVEPPEAPDAEPPSLAVAPEPEIEATVPPRPLIQPILRVVEPAQSESAAPPAPEITPLPPPKIDLPAPDVPTEPTIRVSIGRIDVRIADAPPAKAAPVKRPAPQLSLDEYLRLRSGGKR